MAKRKTRMDDIHEALRQNCELNTRFRRELTRLQLAIKSTSFEGRASTWRFDSCRAAGGCGTP